MSEMSTVAPWAGYRGIELRHCEDQRVGIVCGRDRATEHRQVCCPSASTCGVSETAGGSGPATGEHRCALAAIDRVGKDRYAGIPRGDSLRNCLGSGAGAVIDDPAFQAVASQGIHTALEGLRMLEVRNDRARPDHRTRTTRPDEQVDSRSLNRKPRERSASDQSSSSSSSAPGRITRRNPGPGHARPPVRNRSTARHTIWPTRAVRRQEG